MDRILLFIPMYNCEKQIVRVLNQLTGDVLKYLAEVIVINNRSTDNGEETVKKYISEHDFPIPFRLLRNRENYGLGGSHKVAFQYAQDHGFDYVIVLHGDDQGHIEDIVPYLKNGTYKQYDCLLGARFMKGSELEGYSRFRTFGNKVYDFLFSAVVRHKIYDLGSGLNMYAVRILRDKYYIKYKDNLMFNYCMVLGSAYYRHKVKFFPIRWSEDDQVSNVKMMNQAMTVLKLLGSYAVNPAKFVSAEHRDNTGFEYQADIVAG
ncbi:MAG: glycosyltransferase family 2 protein [Lachnospiraceae bacterium]|jgi:glycosyltransferase involved in cell wall biosynthesis